MSIGAEKEHHNHLGSVPPSADENKMPEFLPLVPVNDVSPCSDVSKESLALMDSPSSDFAPSTSGSQSRLRGIILLNNKMLIWLL